MPAGAEARLLDLAQDIADRAGRVASVADLRGIVDRLASAYLADAPLSAALREDWLRGRGDKTARLALAWAREQLRLALVDVLQRARPAGLVRSDIDAETLAWLWLAATESLAHEPGTAATDRVHFVAAFLSAT